MDGSISLLGVKVCMHSGHTIHMTVKDSLVSQYDRAMGNVGKHYCLCNFLSNIQLYKFMKHRTTDFTTINQSTITFTLHCSISNTLVSAL